VTLPRIDSFVDGASVARIGARTFARLAHVAPDHVLIAPENRICITMLDLLNVEGLVLEPAGALSLDVLDVLRGQIAGKTVVCVVSGGNFDFERLPEVKERAMRFAGTKKYLLLRLPQRPGALRDFLGILGPEDDIARFEYLKKTARNFGSVLLGIETTDPANFTGLFARLDAAGFAYSDITEDEIMANFVI
jgi:threonine dehydratase